jgi:2-amino-4-hydroxy-6-hydroxymethyldihydropteridine diphosphokinase
LGDRERHLQQALSQLEVMEGIEVIAASSIYVSDPVEMADTDAPSFLNQVIKAEYEYQPNELLAGLELIEKRLGRTGKGQKTSRPIDLDILLFGDQIVETEQLSIPHRELLHRPFAMVPLLQIDPDIVHPVTEQPVAQFLSDSDRQSVLLYKDYVARSFRA